MQHARAALWLVHWVSSFGAGGKNHPKRYWQSWHTVLFWVLKQKRASNVLLVRCWHLATWHSCWQCIGGHYGPYVRSLRPRLMSYLSSHHSCTATTCRRDTMLHHGQPLFYHTSRSSYTDKHGTVAAAGHGLLYFSHCCLCICWCIRSGWVTSTTIYTILSGENG